MPASKGSPGTSRSSAWALYERAIEAARVADALADVLTDPDVRIRALRALEQIGPRATAAAPMITAILSHEDVFVRLGATYVLKMVGASAPASALEELRKALQDESLHVPYIASARPSLRSVRQQRCL